MTDNPQKIISQSIENTHIALARINYIANCMIGLQLTIGDELLHISKSIKREIAVMEKANDDMLRTTFENHQKTNGAIIETTLGRISLGKTE